MRREIPLTELEVSDADVEAVLDCLRSGWLTMGPRTQRLEESLAGTIGAKHAIAVSSGTAALHLACRVAGLGPGDEAIVPALSCISAANAPRYCGADVVLCDSRDVFDPGLDIAAVEGLIGPRTKAVVAAHAWGYPVAAEELRDLCDRHGLVLIEDCTEAIRARLGGGADAGTIGDLGCFSFAAEAQLAIGEGGLVTTDDDDLAAAVRSLRSHAMSSVTWERHRGHGLGYDVSDIGFNYRIDEPRAALALSRLDRLDDDIQARREIARFYRQGLAEVEGIELPFADEQVERSSHFAFPILCVDPDARTGLIDGLGDAGVQTAVRSPLHGLDEYKGLAGDDDLPVASEIGARHLCLPIHSSLDEARAVAIVDLAIELLAAKS